ncbi:MAG: hypothetical protein KC503_31170 [Myxococcales bacterium]|nr:hypothetical protein [Myxococcales bacterium]
MSIKAAVRANAPRRASTKQARPTPNRSTRRFSLDAPQPRPADVATPATPSPSPSASPSAPSRVLRALSELEHERAKLDRVIARATRGGTFSPAQLLALQAQIYRLSQDMEITSRVLDRSVGALKSVLSMQV